MKFSRVRNLTIPQGVTAAISSSGRTLWKQTKFRYVSLGDSIAAGEAIRNEPDLYTPYCFAWQYGTWTHPDTNVTYNNTETTILTGSYTDLIGKEVKRQYGNNGYVKSFARSGDTVADLIAKLRYNGGNNPVVSALKEANLVTVCIGANDVLQTALANLGSYINEGAPALRAIEAAIQANLDILNNDNDTNSYTSLLEELNGINPNATYVFTTVYNPLKYFWAEESSEANDYKDGVFGPLMWAIPFGNVTNFIRSSLYNTDAVQMVFDRINGVSRDGSDGLAAFTEIYIKKLNNIITGKIDAYITAGHTNFIVADTKTLYDSFPDRPIPASVHYNDLVSVEFTRGFTVQDMDWEQFWASFSWTDLINSPEVIMEKVITNVVNNVVLPDTNPHPETDGQYALYRSFADALGWELLSRYKVKYATDVGATGAMDEHEVIGLDNAVYMKIKQPEFTPLIGRGYRFENWTANTGASINAYKDANGRVVYYYMNVERDTTLTAHWSNLYNVRFYKDLNDQAKLVYSTEQTGNQSYYKAYTYQDGELIDVPESYYKGTFGNGKKLMSSQPYAYGTRFDVWVTYDRAYGQTTSHIYFNGVLQPVAGAEESYISKYSFVLTNDTDITFECVLSGVILFNATSNWNCHIKTY